MTFKDEGPDQGPLGWVGEQAGEARGGLERSGSSVLDEGRGLDSLLLGEQEPPARVWRELQARLRREGIIR